MNYATDTSPIVVDIETAGLPNAADFLEPCVPDARLKDTEKIKADIAEKEEKRTERLALDWNVGRVVALGWRIDSFDAPVEQVMSLPDENSEAAALVMFWHAAKHRNIVGYNLKSFDLPFLIQRSRYLGVDYPNLDLGKYAKRGIEDLYLMLTFNNGTYDQGAMRRTLKAFAKRFGLPVDDAIDGKDIPALVAAGDWAGVESHLRSDLQLTVALARRLGVLQSEAVTR